LDAGVGGIWIFSTGAGPGARDAYTRFLKFTLLSFIILFP